MSARFRCRLVGSVRDLPACAVRHGYSTLAVMLAVVTTMLLYFKSELRGITQKLSRRDLTSMLQFAVLSFIILPILPDRNFGPPIQ